MLDSALGTEVQGGHVSRAPAHTGAIFGVGAQGLPAVSSTLAFHEGAGFLC